MLYFSCAVSVNHFYGTANRRTIRWEISSNL